MKVIIFNIVQNPVVNSFYLRNCLKVVMFVTALIVKPIVARPTWRETDDNSSTQAIADRSWWIPHQVPEYLAKNYTSDNDNENLSSNISNEPTLQESPDSTPETSKINCTSNEPNQSNQLQNLPEASKKNDFIQFSKYQQPEPKHPEGIRFPATVPLSRNKYKSGIRPRYDNSSEYFKNSLLRWMNAH